MSKLNNLLQLIPKNSIILDSWLKNHGIYNSLKQRYLKSGWLKSLGNGASYKMGDNPAWQDAIIAIQQEMMIHIGGKTALQLEGISHFLQPKILDLHLYGKAGQNLPQWLTHHDWQVILHYYQSKFLPEAAGLKEMLFENNMKMIISAPERALMELLYLIPQTESFEEAYYIMENVNDLDSELVQLLLENCNSIKVKRLFLCLAERANHKWFSLLNVSNINLGSGIRQIVSNGYTDTKYKITVPKSWKEDDTPIF